MNKLTVAATLVVSIAVATAAQAEPDRAASGLGVQSCARFLDDVASDARLEDRYFDWAQGFMAGANGMALSRSLIISM
jgi:hypothetical protein